jgi:hypothetical protein
MHSNYCLITSQSFHESPSDSTFDEYSTLKKNCYIKQVADQLNYNEFINSANIINDRLYTLHLDITY